MRILLAPFDEKRNVIHNCIADCIMEKWNVSCHAARTRDEHCWLAAFLNVYIFFKDLRVGWSTSRSRHSSRTTAGNLEGLFFSLSFFLSNAGHAGFLRQEPCTGEPAAWTHRRTHEINIKRNNQKRRRRKKKKERNKRIERCKYNGA